MTQEEIAGQVRDVRKLLEANVSQFQQKIRREQRYRRDKQRFEHIFGQRRERSKGRPMARDLWEEMGCLSSTKVTAGEDNVR